MEVNVELLDTLIGAAAALVGGFVIGWLVEPVKTFLRGPKLKLSYDENDEACRTHTTLEVGEKATGHDMPTRYTRIRVRNTKPRIAKGCRAYLVRVEKKNVDGTYAQTDYADSIQLAWSGQRGDDKYSPLDIPRGIDQYIDLVEEVPDRGPMEPCLSFRPNKYASLWREASTYRMTVCVAGDGVLPKMKSIEIEWRKSAPSLTAKTGDQESHDQHQSHKWYESLAPAS